MSICISVSTALSLSPSGNSASWTKPEWYRLQYVCIHFYNLNINNICHFFPECKCQGKKPQWPYYRWVAHVNIGLYFLGFFNIHTYGHYITSHSLNLSIPRDTIFFSFLAIKHFLIKVYTSFFKHKGIVHITDLSILYT